MLSRFSRRRRRSRRPKTSRKVNLPCLVTLSAKSADALVAQVEQLLKWLDDNPEAPIGDICYTTNVSRSQFAFRFAAPARSLAELKKHLANMAANHSPKMLRACSAPAMRRSLSCFPVRERSRPAWLRSCIARIPFFGMPWIAAIRWRSRILSTACSR